MSSPWGGGRRGIVAGPAAGEPRVPSLRGGEVQGGSEKVVYRGVGRRANGIKYGALGLLRCKEVVTGVVEGTGLGRDADL